MEAPVQSPEETWFYVQVVIASAAITVALFYISLAIIWNMSLFNDISVKKKMTATAW